MHLKLVQLLFFAIAITFTAGVKAGDKSKMKFILNILY